MTKPKEVNKIFSSTDYDDFNFKADNRPVNENWVNILANEIKKNGQKIPAAVDSRMRILDGQHRFLACKKAGKPFYYYVETTKFDNVQIATINKLSRKWNSKDYCHSFAEQDITDYKLYDSFSKAYPEFSHSINLILLTNATTRKVFEDKRFIEGTFKVKSFNKAKDTADFLRSFAPYYKGYNRRSFVLAVMVLLQHPDFDKNRLMRKMPARCKLLMDFSQEKDYINTLQEIYNWKEMKKISFV
jgi:hypothetical protein